MSGLRSVVRTPLLVTSIAHPDLLPGCSVLLRPCSYFGCGAHPRTFSPTLTNMMLLFPSLGVLFFSFLFKSTLWATSRSTGGRGNETIYFVRQADGPTDLRHRVGRTAFLFSERATTTKVGASDYRAIHHPLGWWMVRQRMLDETNLVVWH